MMFKNNYENGMEKIKPDRYIKDKVRQKLTEKSEPKRKFRTRAYFGTAVAAVLCGVIAISAFSIPNRPIKNEKLNQNKVVMKSAENYGGIYDTLSEFKQTFFDKAKDYVTGGGWAKNSDDYEVVYEYADETAANTGSNTTVTTAPADNETHSSTTVQVEGVDEADIVKTDGNYIYIFGKMAVKIVDTRNGLKQLTDIKITEDLHACQMYLSGDKLVILGGVNDKKESVAIIYDIKDPSNPVKKQVCTQSGYIVSSRVIGDTLYAVTNLYINVNDMEKPYEESYVPYIECKDYNGAVTADSIHIYDNCRRPEYSVICSYSLNDGSLISTKSLLGGSETVYASHNNIITAGYPYNEETQIARFSIDKGQIELKATAALKGGLLNQFSIDEYKDHFRFVLTENVVLKEGEVTDNGSTVTKTVDTTTTLNSLVILDRDLKETGKITNIAPDERVYSVRFMGDIAYFVTFRQVDPLFSVDVSNPKEPKIIGSLKIPGFSNYLFPFGEGKLLGIGQNADEKTGRTGNLKLSLFDISDPSNVTEGDKTDINSTYSEALYNHKASLIDYNRNIIGLPVHTDRGLNYHIYSYIDGSFVKRLDTDIYTADSCRGLYIEDKLYIVNSYEIKCFSLDTFEELETISLK